MQEEVFINSKEVKKMLGLSDTTLWRLRKAGQIPFVEFGSAIRYPKNKLLRWLHQKSSEPLKQAAQS